MVMAGKSTLSMGKAVVDTVVVTGFSCSEELNRFELEKSSTFGHEFEVIWVV